MRRSVESIIKEVSTQSQEWVEFRGFENTFIGATSLLTGLITYVELNRFGGYDIPGSALSGIAWACLTLGMNLTAERFLNRKLRKEIETAEERNHQQISYLLSCDIANFGEEHLSVPKVHVDFLKKRLGGNRGFGLLSMLPEEGINADDLKTELMLRHNNGKGAPVDHEDVLDWLEDLESYHLTEKKIEGPVSIDTPIVFQYKPTRLGSLIL